MKKFIRKPELRFKSFEFTNKTYNLKDVTNELIDCEHKTAPYVECSEYLVVRTSNIKNGVLSYEDIKYTCLLYTSPSPRDQRGSRMPSSA